jgi:competence protein ComEC
LLAAWPWAQVSLPTAPLALGVLAVAGGALAAMRWPWALRLAGLPLVLPFVLWQPPRPAPGQFDVLAADVGQGSATLVRTAGHTLLFDAGPRYASDSDAGQRVLVPLLRALGERVDRLVLSHRDSDHIGGAAAVLAAYPQAQRRPRSSPAARSRACPRARPAWPARAGSGTACASTCCTPAPSRPPRPAAATP